MDFCLLFNTTDTPDLFYFMAGTIISFPLVGGVRIRVQITLEDFEY